MATSSMVMHDGRCCCCAIGDRAQGMTYYRNRVATKKGPFLMRQGCVPRGEAREREGKRGEAPRGAKSAAAQPANVTAANVLCMQAVCMMRYAIISISSICSIAVAIAC